MAAIASPSPAPFTSHYLEPTPNHSGRKTLRVSRRQIAQRASPHGALLPSLASSMKVVPTDSSDDEDIAPIKLSAEAQAILGEDHSQIGGSAKGRRNPPHPNVERALPSQAVHGPLQPESRQRSASANGDDGSPAPRVVRITALSRPSALTTLARDGSFMYKTVDKSSHIASLSLHESKTPLAQLRSVRVNGSRSQTRSPPSNTPNGQSTGSEPASEQPTTLQQGGSPQERQPTSPDNAVYDPATILRLRKGDEQGVQSTMRVRRIGAGTFLNGPVRRGMIRRQSEEDDIPIHQDAYDHTASPEMQIGRRGAEAELVDQPDDLMMNDDSPSSRPKQDVQSRVKALPNTAPVLAATRTTHDNDNTHPKTSPHPRAYNKEEHVTANARSVGSGAKSSTSSSRSRYQLPSLPPLPSINDQENEPPPTFERKRPDTGAYAELASLEHIMAVKTDDGAKAVSISPQRQPLAPVAQNMPHRPAPAPPPKMSMLEAATSVAGSSRGKKTVHVTINGKEYRRLDCIGRGGSSRVYRMMAENYKIFALKRVNLEDADMSAIAGYKGEIDLLKKLENVDRVVRLYDYEVKEDKGVLNVMMELGESDFNKTLNEQLKSENAKLDITFTRHYWKEMLECVKSVHDHGIVHSDLKPANFLLVKGQLKLIDFGIANAIQENTVNVHRENQIGTPNYMSPESLVCHTPAVGAPAGQKLLKLGRPSDVWSLGCILYQMTYGQPPFAHITKQFERIMSIPNPKVEIQFPTTGIGGAVVPFGLIKTLKRCLQREQTMRPTIAELLNEQDPFLNPVAISPEMLGRVIGNVVGYVRKREDALRQQGLLVGDASAVPKDEEMKAWPWAFYEKLKQAQEEGTAW